MFQRKYRRNGNMLIVVSFFLALIILLTGVFSFVGKQKEFARIRATQAGKTSSYIALANLCADAFCNDLESMHGETVIASIGHPGGTDLDPSIYDDAVKTMQAKLENPDAAAPVPSPDTWTYWLHDPNVVIEFSGIADRESLSKIERLLDQSSMDISISAPLSLTYRSDDKSEMMNGDTATISDVIFTIVLKKGTWKVEQTYCLSGEKLVARYSDVKLYYSINNENAQCKLLSQTVTQKNISR